jgi:hypothetical protein
VSDSDQDRDQAEDPESIEPKPTQMLRLEQQVGYVLAGVAAAGSVSAATIGHQPIVGLIGLVTTAVLTLAVRKGHRILAAAGAFLTGFTVATYFVPFEIVLLIYGGFLMMRTSSAQGKARRAQAPMTAAQRREAATARAAARAQRRRGGVATPAAAVKTPPPNRRYTPPKPKARPRPPAPPEKTR